MLIASLTIALDRVEHTKLRLTKWVEWDAFTELPLLVLKPIFNLLLAIKPSGLLLFILLQEFGSFCFKLLLASFLS